MNLTNDTKKVVINCSSENIAKKVLNSIDSHLLVNLGKVIEQETKKSRKEFTGMFCSFSLNG